MNAMTPIQITARDNARTPSLGRTVPTSMLGVALRRRITTLINGLSAGKPIKVVFAGTGAFTNGRQVNLPAIPDLTEMDYGVARSLIGYAIHEASHIMYTDFAYLKREFNALPPLSRMPIGTKRTKLVKHFQNAIEDMRIERDQMAAHPGARSDLTILRNRVHPANDELPPAFWYDPRRSGPLALTWTGSEANGITITGVSHSMTMFEPDLHDLILDWTSRIKGVNSTKQTLDLALAFAKEAEAFVKARQSQQQSDPSEPQAQDEPDDAADSTPGENDSDDSNTQPGDNTDKPDTTPSSDAEPNNDADDTGTDDDADAPGTEPGDETEDYDFDDDEIVAGELDPSKIIDQVLGAAHAAPQYDSSKTGQQTGGNTPNGQGDWVDTRFEPITTADDAAAIYSQLNAEAAGVIANTARAVRRLLRAQSTRGEVRGKASGIFDIRAVSAIVRGTGNTYRREWTQPALTTHVLILIDASGSMSSGSLRIAMLGTIAVERAIMGTSITTEIHAYTSGNQCVKLTTLKRAKTDRRRTALNIGSYNEIHMGCTPTGEAMAAAIERLETVKADRLMLLVLTDGDADNAQLCATVAGLAERRGIEVAAIGIGSDSVAAWAPRYGIIDDIGKLPDALLAAIDPRGLRKQIR